LCLREVEDMFGRKPTSVDSSQSTLSTSSAARTLSRATSRELIPHIRALAESLQRATESQLLGEVTEVRRELARGHKNSEPHLLAAGLALACEAMRRARNITLYDVQLIAAMAMSRRCIAQMQTGEGKTFVALTASLYLAMAGRGVHVITPNVYLAERDFKLASGVAGVLGLSAALLPERTDAVQKTPAYDADITYGTGHEFGFDYLRDQLTLRQQAQHRLGERLLHHLDSPSTSRRLTMQRGLSYAVIDEADSVLIDDASSPLVLSFGSNESAPDTDAHLTARALALALKQGDDFRLDAATGRAILTEAGVRRCHASDVAIPVLQLVRPWTEYVQQALRAMFLFRRDVHYVIQNDEVRIVDETTGRIFEDRSWQDGLHQAIEASQGLKITAEKQSVAQVTRQRFFRLYEHLSGMTGTAIGCERELQDVYQLEVEEIPLRVASRRKLLSTRFFSTSSARHQAVLESAVACRDQGRAVLIGTRSIADSELLELGLQDRAIPVQLLNGLQNADEAEIISAAGQPGAITIATNLAGRGTDISLHESVKECGGLHVIVTECQTSGRMDRQLIGRCGRQGDPGSAQVFASAEDTLVTQFGPWLANALRREADALCEVHSNFTSQLQRLQTTAERQQYSARVNMLRRDIARDTLLRSMR
jgi:preprotein translocase subunit SecA